MDDARAGSKQDQLRRMRWLATSLLGAMLALLIASAAYQSGYPWLHWIRAFAEAGAVGAMADWYAVTALFRYPLGLPIPHTAIIPSNKDRIGASLGDFVEQNFLTPENILARLREHNLAKALAKWLAAPPKSQALAKAIGEFIPQFLDALEDADLKRFFDRTVTSQLLTLNVSRIAGNILALLTEDDRHQALLDRALHALERLLVANAGLIKEKFGEASRYTPGRLDRYLVNKFVEGIVALLHEVVDSPQHELRKQFDQAVRKLIHDLTSSEDYREKGEVLWHKLVEHLQNEDYYRSLWDEIKMRVKADLDHEPSVLRSHIAGALTLLGEKLLDEPAVQEQLNAWWLNALHKIVLRYRHQISSLITGVVQGWDAEQISRKIELEIGKDLQYIRINGTFVGGAVGVLLHAATTLVALG